jgi:hypothetical protein
MALRRKDHLARAKEYIAQGDNCYLKAADEIAAWLGEDSARTQRQAAEIIGHHVSTVNRLLLLRRNNRDDSSQTTPDWGRGSHATTEEIEQGVKKALADPAKAKSLAPSIAKAMEDPEVAQAVSTESSLGALRNVDAAATTEVYMRQRGGRTQPPADAASRSLGGVGPAAMSDQIFGMALEPHLTRIEGALASLKTHVGIKGAHLPLTEVEEFDKLAERMAAMGALFAFMLDAVEDAKRAKLANETEGASR